MDETATPVDANETDVRLIRLHPDDNCLVAIRPLKAGDHLIVAGELVELDANLPVGHKVAARNLNVGDVVRKCGAAIGVTSAAVAAGHHLHLHNLKSTYLAAHLVGGGSSDEGAHAARREGGPDATT